MEQLIADLTQHIINEPNGKVNIENLFKGREELLPMFQMKTEDGFLDSSFNDLHNEPPAIFIRKKRKTKVYLCEVCNYRGSNMNRHKRSKRHKKKVLLAEANNNINNIETKEPVNIINNESS